jgi:hypothetical protein
MYHANAAVRLTIRPGAKKMRRCTLNWRCLRYRWLAAQDGTSNTTLTLRRLAVAPQSVIRTYARLWMQQFVDASRPQPPATQEYRAIVPGFS